MRESVIHLCWAIFILSTLLIMSGAFAAYWPRKGMIEDMPGAVFAIGCVGVATSLVIMIIVAFKAA